MKAYDPSIDTSASRMLQDSHRLTRRFSGPPTGASAATNCWAPAYADQTSMPSGTSDAGKGTTIA